MEDMTFYHWEVESPDPPLGLLLYLPSGVGEGWHHSSVVDEGHLVTDGWESKPRYLTWSPLELLKGDPLLANENERPGA